MPQAIAYGLAAVFTGGVVTTGITVAAYAITAAVTYGISNAQKKKAERSARAQQDAAQTDRMANVPTTLGTRELVLGRVRKGGNVFFRASWGPGSPVFVMCVALAAHEIANVERVYFNDIPIDLDGGGNVTTAPWGRNNTRSERETSADPVRTLVAPPIPGSVQVMEAAQSGSSDWFYPNGANSLPYTLSGTTLTIEDYDPSKFYTVAYQWTEFVSTARVYMHLGTDSQAADPHLMAYFPDVWTSEHRAAGVAYLVCEFVYEESSFPSGLPAVTAQIAGAKVYDPRNGTTNFTENPALLMRHVMLHPQFGKRTSLTAAEDARIIAAANACDQVVTYGGASDAVPAFRAGTVAQFGTPAKDVLDDLSQAMGGMWAYAAGEIFIRPGIWNAPVMTLTEADLAVERRDSSGAVSQSPIGISVHKARAEKVNVVVPRIWDRAQGGIQAALTPMKAPELIAKDGAELVQEVTMPAVFYSYQALHIAAMLIRDARDPLTVTLPFKLRAYPLELFDSVWLTLPRYGWASKEFVILGRSFSADGAIQLTMKETAAAIFQRNTSFPAQGFADNTMLPRPWDIHPPQITSIKSGEAELIVQTDGTVVNSVRVTWAPVNDASVVQSGSIEIQFQVLPSGDWRSVSVPGTAIEARLTGVDDLAVILIRARTRNSLAASDWSPQQTHQVLGKTEPPPNIEQLAVSGSVLTWTLPRRVPDLAGFVFRFQYGNNLDWNSAAPLHSGLITESPYDLITRPGGVVTIMGKAQDTSGNQSLATANIVMNLGDPSIANVIEQWDFDALGWPFEAAESSGWTIDAGKPSADSLDSFYGTDDQSFYGGDTDSFYEPGAYGQMVYVTPPIAITSALAGSIMTVLADAQGIDLHIDYRLAGPGTFYGPDNDSFYGADADPFYGPPGGWQPWPGQLVASRDAYQFRVTIGAGIERGVLQSLVVTIDAPDIEEVIEDLAIAAAGTAIPFTKPFTVIKAITATLQTNGSGAVTVETNKTLPLAPVIRAFSAAHTAVSGATADIVLKGY